MHRKFLVAACIVLLLSLYTLQGSIVAYVTNVTLLSLGAHAKPLRVAGECDRNEECGLGVLCINRTCVYVIDIGTFSSHVVFQTLHKEFSMSRFH